MNRTGQTIAASFALSAFAVSVCSGLAAEISTTQVLMRSALAMIVCYLIGWLVGFVCQWVIAAHVTAKLSEKDQPLSEGELSTGASLSGVGERPVVI